jgi:hypothetical protein
VLAARVLGLIGSVRPMQRHARAPQTQSFGRETDDIEAEVRLARGRSEATSNSAVGTSVSCFRDLTEVRPVVGVSAVMGWLDR